MTFTSGVLRRAKRGEGDVERSTGGRISDEIKEELTKMKDRG